MRGWRQTLDNKVTLTRDAALKTATLPTTVKNAFIERLAENIIAGAGRIQKSNKRDIAAARKAALSDAFIDRLVLDDARLAAMAASVRTVASLPDPVGTRTWETIRPNGLRIERIRVPIGVIGIIYESRPDVTVEASVLCVKAGNGVVLRGGKEAVFSNRALVAVIKESLEQAGMDPETVNLVSTGGRMAVNHLLSLREQIDLIIPRGGESLIRAVAERSRIPVIKHYKGICATYVHHDALLPMAWDVVYNAKVQRPGTCNATETLLVHRDIAGRFLPRMAERFALAGVEMRGCERTRDIIPAAKPAIEADWSAEFLDLIIAVKIVDSLDEAIGHINRFGTKHSDAILTEDDKAAGEFMARVDSACLYHNTSTRFTDGGEFGFGAEIGISTDKIHARGPMGLEELTSYKYLIHGHGQIRS